MATWGRTTDIEFVYGVEIDEHDQILAEEFQGPGHEVPPFKGTHEGGHPLLWVSTDNNMVSESGPTQVRYAPAAGAIRPRRPVARSGDGSPCLDLRRGGAGDDARRKDRGRRRQRDRERFPISAATSTSRRARSSRMPPSRFRSERRTARERRDGTTPIAASASSASCAAGVSGAPSRCRLRPDGQRRFGFVRSPALNAARRLAPSSVVLTRVNTRLLPRRAVSARAVALLMDRFDRVAGRRRLARTALLITIHRRAAERSQRVFS